MNHIKMFEDFWPLWNRRHISNKEINLKKISDIPKILKEWGIGSGILGLQVSKIEIGQSRNNPHRLIVDFRDSNKFVRILFKLNENLQIIGKDSCYYIIDNKVIINSLKNIPKYRREIKQMVELQEKIFKVFEKESLI